jgi:sugar-specific transcriptional regulator TrmB
VNVRICFQFNPIANMYNVSYSYDNTMENPLFEQLVELGLSNYEAGVYLTLLEHSPTSAGFVAKKLGYSRSTVYAALDKLTCRGLVGTTYKNGVKQFIAEQPKRLGEILHEEQLTIAKRAELFAKMSNQLQFLSRANTQVPNIIFFEGWESLKKIYLNMLRAAPKNATMYIMRSEFYWTPEWKFIFGDEWSNQVKSWRSERNITTQVLVNSSKEEQKHLSFYKSRKHTRARFLPKEQSVKDFALYILGDTVSILSLEKNNSVGVKITNQVLADNFKKIFGGLWDGAKKV